uniref:Glycoside hydrolase family 3 C-terminal domain-containing protein n=1 Tax=Triticum urartu TaxID=4572 RepID=A0A8R7TV22_TRIUA
MQVLVIALSSFLQSVLPAQFGMHDQRDMAREVARKSLVILKNGKTPSDAPLHQLPKMPSDAQLLPLPKKMTSTNDGLICVQLHCLFLNQWRSFLLIILTRTLCFLSRDCFCSCLFIVIYHFLNLLQHSMCSTILLLCKDFGRI